MPPFAAELRECLELVLGAPVPEPEGDVLVFLRQWLAERNLGLVPIAEPSEFSWPGHWLARVGEHAVVMFGSPSGPLHDPSGALADGGEVDEGWLLARLDVHLPIGEPAAAPGAGAVAAICLAPDAEAPLARVESVEAVAGRGLRGDRYCDGRGTFSTPGGRGYELTLVEGEVLDELGLPWEEARRNVVTHGIELNALVGRRFAIGAVECVGRRLAEPCAHLEKLARPGLLRPLVHRGGLRADIVRGGTIAVGDSVVSL